MFSQILLFDVNNFSKIFLYEKVSISINFDTLTSIHSILSLEPTCGFLSNLYRFTTGRLQNVDEVLVTLTLFSRLQ